MPYPDLLRLHFDRSDALQGYWTLYVVVIGGLLACSALRQRPDRIKSVLVTLLYVGFAHKNLAAIGDATAERMAIPHAMAVPPAEAALFNSEMQAALDPTPYADARNFHVACDVLTLAAVRAMELSRRRPEAMPLAGAR